MLYRLLNEMILNEFCLLLLLKIHFVRNSGRKVKHFFSIYQINGSIFMAIHYNFGFSAL
jgi:peptidyl-tRNA hydrolase